MGEVHPGRRFEVQAVEAASPGVARAEEQAELTFGARDDPGGKDFADGAAGKGVAELELELIERGRGIRVVGDHPHLQLGVASGRGRLELLPCKGVDLAPRTPVAANDLESVDRALEAGDQLVVAPRGDFLAVFVVVGEAVFDLVARAAADLEPGIGWDVGAPGDRVEASGALQVDDMRTEFEFVRETLAEDLKFLGETAIGPAVVDLPTLPQHADKAGRHQPEFVGGGAGDPPGAVAGGVGIVLAPDQRAVGG